MKAKMRMYQVAAFALALALLSALGPVTLAGLTTGSETVEGDLVHGTSSWHYKYKRSFDGTKITKNVEIKFTFVGTYTEDEKTKYLSDTEASIEGLWNGKYSVKDKKTGKLYPCVVDLTTVGPFDHDVTIRKTKGASDPPYDAGNWYSEEDKTEPYGPAHEFGHMLGQYDEYAGGWQDPTSPITDDNALMGGGAEKQDPTMPKRYYEQFGDYLKKLNPTGDFQVVPEPMTVVILALGFAAVSRRRRRRTAA